MLRDDEMAQRSSSIFGTAASREKRRWPFAGTLRWEIVVTGAPRIRDSVKRWPFDEL